MELPKVSLPRRVGLGVLAVLVGGGLVVWIGIWRSIGENADLEERLAEATEQQQARQAMIDADYFACTSGWIEQTSLNIVQTEDAVIPLRDVPAAAAEHEPRLQALCDTGNTIAYCEATGELVVTWASDAGIDPIEIVEGCMEAFESSIPPTSSVRAGDCLVYHPAGFERVYCSEQHDGLVVAVFEMPGTTFPGDQAVFDYADRNCPIEADNLSTPGQGDWSTGYRLIICLDE